MAGIDEATEPPATESPVQTVDSGPTALPPTETIVEPTVLPDEDVDPATEEPDPELRSGILAFQQPDAIPDCDPITQPTEPPAPTQPPSGNNGDGGNGDAGNGGGSGGGEALAGGGGTSAGDAVSVAQLPATGASPASGANLSFGSAILLAIGSLAIRHSKR